MPKKGGGKKPGGSADIEGEAEAADQAGVQAGEPRTVGYLRVSTADQDTHKFRADVLQFAADRGFGRVAFVAETVSGKRPWRDRELAGVVDGLQKGDRLIVPELSRLGRSMLEVLEIIQVARDKGAFIYAVKGGWELADNLQSKILSMVMAMMAEIERDLISERTREALKAKQDAGVQLGRPRGPGKSKLDPYEDEIRNLRAAGSTKVFIARRMGTTAQNLAHWMAGRGIE